MHGSHLRVYPVLVLQETRYVSRIERVRPFPVLRLHERKAGRDRYPFSRTDEGAVPSSPRCWPKSNAACGAKGQHDCACSIGFCASSRPSQSKVV